MRRRSLLASGAALLGSGFAGCLDRSGDSSTTQPSETTASSTTDVTTTTTTDTASQFDGELDVTVGRHQHGVVLLGIDSVGVAGPSSQYVFYHVDVTDGIPPERTDFGFRYGGTVIGPGVGTGGGQLWRASETDTRYAVERGRGWLVFELPPERVADHAALALGSEEWPAPEWLRDRLSKPQPPLSVEWGLADDQPDDAAGLSFDVTNEGAVDTRFVAALNSVELSAAHAPVAAFHRGVPAGETVSWTVTDEEAGAVVASSEADSNGHYELEWTQGESSLFVERPSGE